jgi:four helix bundle protein
MPFVRFQELDVYQLAEVLADTVWEIAEKWNTFARDTVGKQLVRAADSIGANISEGTGRGSRVDNRRFVRISRGSFNETQHWLRRAFNRKLLTPEQTMTLQGQIDKLGSKLNAYLSSFDRATSKSTHNAKGNTKHETPNTQHQTPNTKHETPNTKH